MKTAISAHQLVHFRQQGHIRFEDFPLDFHTIESLARKAESKRDFWRKDPATKKQILHNMAPIALELTRKPALRLGCDQWIDTPPKSGRMQDMFCIQGIACLFIFSQDEAAPDKGTILDVFEPSSLVSLLAPNSYLVAFTQENAVLIQNLKDPFNLETRNLGYAYGDRLRNEFHPLIHAR